jgi:hypothetical protein
VYEALQEAQRLNAKCKILFGPSLDRAACDAIDLPRVKLTVVRSSQPGPPTALHAAGLEHRVQWLDPSQTHFTPVQWHMIFCCEKDTHDPLFQRLQAAQAAQATVIVDQLDPPPVRACL